VTRCGRAAADTVEKLKKELTPTYIDLTTICSCGRGLQMKADECATHDLPVVIVLGVFPRILPGAIGVPARHNYSTRSTANGTQHLRTKKVLQLSTMSAACETPQYPGGRTIIVAILLPGC
jgi:hypothetical protein